MQRIQNPVSKLHQSIAHAVYVAAPDVQYEQKDFAQSKELGHPVYKTKYRRPREDEILVMEMFPQVWASTALGFGGIGGSAMTTAYTIVLMFNDLCMVYFDGRYAYTVSNSGDTQRFEKDLSTKNLASCSDAKSLYPLFEQNTCAISLL